MPSPLEAASFARNAIVEPFKIICVTCHAGLSVRNESLVGQIVACPKCGSMVQIELPAQAEPPVGESTSVHRNGNPAAGGITAATESNSAFLAWSIGGLALAASLFGAILLWPTNPAEGDAPAPSAQVEKPVVEVPKPPQVEPTEEPAPAVMVEETSAVPAPNSKASPVPPQVTVAKKEAVVEESAETATTQAKVAQPEAPRVARQFDALDLDPEDVDLATLDRGAEVSPTLKTDEPPPRPEPAASTEPVARRGAAPDRNLSNRDAKEHFARRLPALSVKEMPLMDFLSLMSQLSGVPVSVGPEHLQMAGISAREPISIDVHDKSLDEVLTQALDKLRLAHDFHGAQVVVVRQGADQVREIDYPVDDLKAEPEQLATWIKQLIAPASWQTAKLIIDGGQLRIEQTQLVHYQVLVFLERLRLVSGQTPRSKYPIKRLAPTPLHAAMAERLTAPALFTFSRETPLAEVFHHWQQEIDMPLLIDWPAIAEVDLWPESTILCAVADKRWEEALSEVLAPLGLDWRATFGGAIEISSAEKLAVDPQLELYPLVATNAQNAAELKRKIGATGNDFIIDSATSALIARQPASAQRQILNWLIEKKLIRPR